MYLSVRMMVSPPKSHQRLCMSESRYGYAYRVRRILIVYYAVTGQAAQTSRSTHGFETVRPKLSDG